MRILPVLVTAALAFATLPAQADEEQIDWKDIQFSAGVGVNYTGLGASLGYVNEDTYYSVSLGLMTSSDTYGEVFGLGLSYQRSDLLHEWFGWSEKHALGAYAGSMGTDITTSLQNGSSYWRSEDRLGAALTYNYFFNGMTASGFHIGTYAGYSFSNIKNLSEAGIQIGYRF